jgi:hypothetical protein
MSVIDDQRDDLGSVECVSYNIRFHPIWPSPSAKQVLDWIENNATDAKLFESFDGGGGNGLILECQRSDEVVQFCLEWLGGESSRCWAEDQRGHHHRFVIKDGEIHFRARGGSGFGSERHR